MEWPWKGFWNCCEARLPIFFRLFHRPVHNKEIQTVDGLCYLGIYRLLDSYLVGLWKAVYVSLQTHALQFTSDHFSFPEIRERIFVFAIFESDVHIEKDLDVNSFFDQDPFDLV